MTTTLKSPPDLAIGTEIGNEALTELLKIKELIGSKILEAYDYVTHNHQLAYATKMKLLLKLATGDQTCGCIDGINDMEDFEELLETTEALRSSNVYFTGAYGHKIYHVYEFQIPKGKFAFTEWTDVQTLYSNCMHYSIKIDLIAAINGKPNRYVFKAPEIDPVKTDVWHAVLEWQNGEFVFNSWAPGQYRARVGATDGNNLGDFPVKVGRIEEHRKIITQKMREQARTDIENANYIREAPADLTVAYKCDSAPASGGCVQPAVTV